MKPERVTWAMDMVNRPNGSAIYVVLKCDDGAAYVFISREPMIRAAAVHLGRAIAEYGAPNIIKTDNAVAFHTPRFQHALNCRGISHQIVTAQDADMAAVEKLLRETIEQLPPSQTVREEHPRNQRRFTRHLAFLRNDQVLFRQMFTDMAKARAMQSAWEKGATQAEMVDLQRA